MKICSQCGCDEVTTKFYSWTHNGYQGKRCKLCMQASRKKYQTPERKKAEIIKRIDRNRMEVCDIRPDQYSFMVIAQKGRCKNCGLPSGKRALSVDHDHTVGIVRGLLCHKCNRGIGLFRDNPSLLLKTALYLERRDVRRRITSIFE